MTPDRCPNCRGDLRAKVVGEMQDKRLECAHCGTEVEVLDEFSVEDGESESFVDDRGRRVVRSTKRVRTRRDLPGGEDRTLAREVRSKLDVGPSSVELVVESTATGKGLEGMLGPGGIRELLSGKGLGVELSANAVEELRRSLHLPPDAPVFFQRPEDEGAAQELLSKLLSDGGSEERHAGAWASIGTHPARRSVARAASGAPAPWGEPVRDRGPETWKTLAAVGFGVVITLLVIAVL